MSARQSKHKERRKNRCMRIMIILTKLNDQKFALNHKMVETIQETPDTTIRLSNGNMYIVKEPMETVLNMIYRYDKGINA